MKLSVLFPFALAGAALGLVRHQQVLSDQSAFVRNNAPWTLARIAQPNGIVPHLSEITSKAYTYPDKQLGEGVYVYVVDSGIKVDHPDLVGVKFVPGAARGGWNPQDDKAGHGTAVASLIAGRKNGAAHKATIVSIRIVEEDTQETMQSTTHALEGINLAIEHFQKQLQQNDKLRGVINVSWAMRYTGVLDTDKAAEKAIMEITSVGNDDGDTLCYSDNENSQVNYKTRMKEVGQIVVGSSTVIDSPAKHSGRGSCITIWAPGEDVEVADLPEGFRRTEGTSYAAAYVSGVVAAMLSQEVIKPGQLAEKLEKYATQDIIAPVSRFPRETTSLLHMPAKFYGDPPHVVQRLHW